MKRQGELVKVSSLFAKYQKNLTAPQASVIKVVVEVIYDVCGFKIESKQVTYAVHSKTVTIQLPSVLKHELQRHNEEILLHLKGRLGEKSCPKYIR